MTRPFRGAAYRVEIRRDASLPDGVDLEVRLDGRLLSTPLLPFPRAGEKHEVAVRVR